MLLKEVGSTLYADSVNTPLITIVLIALKVVMHYRPMLAVRMDIGTG
jgi:hypothetical protein